MTERNGEFSKGQAYTAPERNWKNTSHEELVTGIRQTLSRVKANFETRHGPNTFDPFEWVSSYLTPGMHNQSKAKRDLSHAWDAISLPFLKGQYQRGTKEALETASRTHRYITLEPTAAKILDALAEAVNIPHERGKATIDILQNIPPAEEKRAQRFFTVVKRMFTSDREKREKKPETKLMPEEGMSLSAFLYKILEEQQEEQRKLT